MSFLEAIVEAARSVYCQRAELSQRLWREPPGLDLFGFGERAFAFRDWSIREWCNREPPPSPPGFPGGQCEFCYLITTNVTIAGSSGSQNGTFNFSNTYWGPVSLIGVTRTVQDNGNFLFEVRLSTHGSCSLPRSEASELTIFQSSSQLSGSTFTLNSIVVVPSAGGPDDCGTGPAPIEPYNPNDFSGDIDITYVNNDGIDVTVPVGFLIAPVYVDADLNVNIPVKFTFSPNFNFNPTFKYDLQVNFNLGTGDTTISPPTPPGVNPPRPLPDFDFDADIDIDINPPSPPVPPDVSDPPDEPATDEARATIRAAIVTTTAIDNPSIVGLIGQDDNPDVWIPDLGLLSFQVRTRGGIAWTTDVKIKNKRQLIPCEWIGGAIDVRATPRPGVQLSVTPVYGQPSKEV